MSLHPIQCVTIPSQPYSVTRAPPNASPFLQPLDRHQGFTDPHQQSSERVRNLLRIEGRVLSSARIRLISLNLEYGSGADDCNDVLSFNEIGNSSKPRRSLQERPFPNPYILARHRGRK